MTLDKLSSLRSARSSTAGGKGSRRAPVVLLPLGLLLAFAAVFAVLFGERLLPARDVQVAPVITLRRAQSESPGAPVPVAAAGATGHRQLLFQASGWVEPDPYITNVPVLVNGVVKDVLVLEGQAVKNDELLATLIDDDARLDVEEAERKIRTLDATQVAHCAQLPVLNSELNAIQKRIAAEQALLAELTDTADRLASVPKGSVPELDVRKARLQVDRQQAALEEAQAQLPNVLARINKVDLERLTVEARIKEAQTDLNRKKLALERTRIKASIDGIVLRLHAAPGKKRMIEADDPDSALIVELYDPDNLQARIDVPLTEAAGLRVGQPVHLKTDLLPDASFNGEVTRIVGEADLQRNTLQAKVRITNPDERLRPEMLVRAEFFPKPAEPVDADSSPPPSSTTAPSRLALYAPKAGLLDLNRSSARAWIADGNRAQLRQVTLGAEEREGHRLVLDGLRPGDQVILPPHHNLEPGDRINVLEQSSHHSNN